MGEVIASATESTAAGNVQYIQKEVSGKDEKIDISEPRIYFGLDTKETIATNAKNKQEYDYTDENGNDITEKHRDETVKGSWGSGTGSAELGTVYVLMAITGFVGAVLVRYFLWDEENNLS